MKVLAALAVVVLIIASLFTSAYSLPEPEPKRYGHGGGGHYGHGGGGHYGHGGGHHGGGHYGHGHGHYG